MGWDQQRAKRRNLRTKFPKGWTKDVGQAAGHWLKKDMGWTWAGTSNEPSIGILITKFPKVNRL